MDDRMRRAIANRAFSWRDAGRPAGFGLHFRLLAELELGAVTRLGRHDPFLVLMRMAASVAAARSPLPPVAVLRVVHRC